MAKKPKTPPPPRSVQTPKRRYEPTTGGLGGRGLYVAVAAAAVLVAGVAIAFAATRGGGADAAKQLAAAGCSFKTYPDQGQQHVQSLTAKVDYNSFPPTSGRHYFQPALWGFYDDPLASQVQVVHNLEHGGVVVQWGSGVPSTTVEQLRGFWQDSPNGMLMAPLPKLGDKIALTAWTHLATCRSFDEGAFKAFRDAYRTKGPERFPLSALQPGS